MPVKKEIEIRYFINPSLFIYKNLDKETNSKLLQLEVDLQKYVCNFEQNKEKNDDFVPTIGEIILAFNCELKKWYRFKVLLVDKKENIYGLALDYGNIGIVKLKRTIPLTDRTLAAIDFGFYSIGGLSNVIPAKYVSVNLVFFIFVFFLLT